MQRSFGFDVLACPRCGDRLELIALIEDPKVIRRILSHLSLPTKVPAARPGGRRRSQSDDRIRGTTRTCRCPDASHRTELRDGAPTTARSGTVRPRHEFSCRRLTGVFKRRMIRAVRAAIRAVLAERAGPHKGIPSTTGAKTPANGSYRLLVMTPSGDADDPPTMLVNSPASLKGEGIK
jgi:hypothetical protein